MNTLNECHRQMKFSWYILMRVPTYFLVGLTAIAHHESESKTASHQCLIEKYNQEMQSSRFKIVSKLNLACSLHLIKRGI